MIAVLGRLLARVAGPMILGKLIKKIRGGKRGMRTRPVRKAPRSAMKKGGRKPRGRGRK